MFTPIMSDASMLCKHFPLIDSPARVKMFSKIFLTSRGQFRKICGPCVTTVRVFTGRPSSIDLTRFKLRDRGCQNTYNVLDVWNSSFIEAIHQVEKLKYLLDI